MFPVRYFPKTYYAPTFFPPGDGDTPGVIYVSVSDNVTALSDVFKELHTVRTLSDNVTALSDVAKELHAVRVLSDSAGITDTVSSTIILYRSVFDTVSSSDTVWRTAQSRRILVDVMTPQDVVSRVYTGRRVVFDAASYADAISKGQFRSLFDTVTGDDSTNTSRIIRSMIVDSVGGTDAPFNIRDIVALLSNVLSISDGADATVTSIARQIIESVGVHDYMNAGLLLTALLSEDVNIHDSVLAFLRTTDIPCIVDLSVEGQGGIIESVMSGTPLIKTASGLLIPNMSSTDAGDAEVVAGGVVGTPNIIGRKEERDCNG